jgi:hypothetical protein
VKQLETLNHVSTKLLISEVTGRRVTVFAELRWQVDPIDCHFCGRIVIVAVSIIVYLQNKGCRRGNKFVYAGCGGSGNRAIFDRAFFACNLDKEDGVQALVAGYDNI